MAHVAFGCICSPAGFQLELESSLCQQDVQDESTIQCIYVPTKLLSAYETLSSRSEAALPQAEFSEWWFPLGVALNQGEKATFFGPSDPFEGQCA